MNVDDEMKTKVLEWLDSGEAVFAEQMPIILEQMIEYGGLNNIIQGVSQLFLIFVGVWMLRLWDKKYQKFEDEGYYTDPWWGGREPTFKLAVGGVLSIVIGFISLMIFMFDTLPTLAQLYAAPNLYVLEQIRAMT